MKGDLEVGIWSIKRKCQDGYENSEATSPNSRKKATVLCIFTQKLSSATSFIRKPLGEIVYEYLGRKNHVFVAYHNLTRHPLWNLKERYMAIFSVCGFPEIEHFKPLVEIFKRTAINSHRPLIATILRPGAEFFTAPPYRNYLNEILTSLVQAGKELVEQGKISKRILKSISSDYGISKELWRTYSNLHWLLKRKGGDKYE